MTLPKLGRAEKGGGVSPHIPSSSVVLPPLISDKNPIFPAASTQNSLGFYNDLCCMAYWARVVFVMSAPIFPAAVILSEGSVYDKIQIAVSAFCPVTREASLWSCYSLVINGGFEWPWEFLFIVIKMQHKITILFKNVLFSGIKYIYNAVWPSPISGPQNFLLPQEETPQFLSSDSLFLLFPSSRWSTCCLCRFAHSRQFM